MNDDRVRTGGFVGFAVLAAMAVTNARVLSPDTFYSLYSGRFIVQHGLPRTDSLTFAGHGRPWIDQQWLAHVALYDAWRLDGYPLVGLLSAALIALAFGAFALILVQLGVSPVRTTLWSVIAFFVCQTNTATRAQSFAYPLFVCVFGAILGDAVRRREPTRLLVGCVPLLVLWANLHGSVVLAAPLFAGYCLTRVLGSARVGRSRDAAGYLALAVCGSLAPLATPYGVRIWGYYESVLNNPELQHASAEWHATTLSPSNLQFILLGVLVLALGPMAMRRGYRPLPVLAAFTLILAAAGVDSVRNQAWFAFPAAAFVTVGLGAPVGAAAEEAASRTRRAARIPPAVRDAALPAAASVLFAVFAALALRGPQTERAQVFALLVGVVITSTILADRRRGRRMRSAATAAFAIAVACSVGALLTTTGAQFSRLTPAAAVGHAAALADAHPDTRVLADDFASGPLLWRAPGLAGRVGFDPRFEIYRPAGLRRYVAFISGTRSWSRVLRPYDVVIVSRFQNPDLVTRMRRLAGWRLDYTDHTGAVFVRSS